MKFCSKLVWWYWAITTALLVGILAGYSLCLQAVIALNIVQVVHFIIREKSISAFPIQVRITYLGLLFAAQAPYMVWIFWWQLIGTSAMISFGYCFLARILSLLPWNKKESYSLEMLKKTFLTPPEKNNVMHGLPVLAK
jgi:uncharacterized membrane protein YedE/YeeE